MPRYNVPMEFDSEDKIIGGILSLRQMAYCSVAGSVDLGLWFLGFIPTTVRVFLMILPSVLGLALAFIEHPIHGRLDKFLLAYLRYSRRPKAYIQGGDSD